LFSGDGYLSPDRSGNPFSGFFCQKKIEANSRKKLLKNKPL